MDAHPEPAAPLAEHPGGGHEPLTIDTRPLLVGLAVLLAAAVLVHVALGAMLQQLKKQETGRVGLPPAPRLDAAENNPKLQASPAEDTVQMLNEEELLLDGTSWIDREAGIARIPIEAAMRLVVERGLPAPAAPPADATPGETNAEAPQ